MKPNKPAIRKWVKALESGKYKQGFGVLNNNNQKFCCLGVACELFPQYSGKKICIDGTYHYGQEYAMLPTTLAEYLGITYNGELNFPMEYKTLTNHTLYRLNDMKMPFKQIAKVIRKQFLGEKI